MDGTIAGKNAIRIQNRRIQNKSNAVLCADRISDSSDSDSYAQFGIWIDGTVCLTSDGRGTVDRRDHDTTNNAMDTVDNGYYVPISGAVRLLDMSAVACVSDTMTSRAYTVRTVFGTAQTAARAIVFVLRGYWRDMRIWFVGYAFVAATTHGCCGCAS